MDMYEVNEDLINNLINDILRTHFVSFQSTTLKPNIKGIIVTIFEELWLKTDTLLKNAVISTPEYPVVFI